MGRRRSPKPALDHLGRGLQTFKFQRVLRLQQAQEVGFACAESIG